MTVTNTLTPIAPSATGSFTIRKDVVDASGIGVTGTFTGTVVCVAGALLVAGRRRRRG